MRTKNKAWLAGYLSFANTTITWEETCVLAFLESTRRNPQKLTPNTAFNYLSAIRKFLQNGGVATDFMATSQYIRDTKAAMKIAKTGITVKDTVRLPVSMRPNAENIPPSTWQCTTRKSWHSPRSRECQNTCTQAK